MFDTRAWRGPAVVGGDGIEPPRFPNFGKKKLGNDDYR
jgi:hypothetical protein